MAFRFTQEDFKRYVKQAEHGGRHIWHDLQDRLKKRFGISFAAVPYRARGDRLYKIWLPPKGTPRGEWSHQAAFFLARSLESKSLTFGLIIECCTLAWLSQEGYDTDQDGVRLTTSLESDPDFVALIEQFIADSNWQVYFADRAVQSIADLLENIKLVHDKKYWVVSICRTLSAETAISLGESIVDEIMKAYVTVQPLWEALIPDRDYEYLEEHKPGHQKENRKDSTRAQHVLETLIPDVETRRLCLDLMADYILAAHALSPATWEITLFEDRVRLNIGKIQSFVIYPNEVYLVLDARSLVDSEKQTLVSLGHSPQQEYASVAATYDIQLQAEHVHNVTELIEKAYKPLVTRAAQSARRTPFYRHHTPSVVAYLREFLGREIPDPDYGESPQEPEVTPDPQTFDLSSILKAQMIAQGLHYTPWQIATFYSALQTKGFVILSGISGTGKTKLAQAFAALLSSTDGTTFVSVRPDWRDSKSLLGFYNPLTGTYQWTPFLRFLQRAVRSFSDQEGRAWFVILDEMNLARVEYYFADLLSVLESGRDNQGWTQEPLRLYYPDDAEGDLPPKEIPLPPNLYIVGTVNVDETTHAFSPKVLDRAFTLELTAVNLQDYPPRLNDEGATELTGAHRQFALSRFTRQGKFARIDKGLINPTIENHPELRDQLHNLNQVLQPYQLHFGYRVFDEIITYVALAEDHQLYTQLGDADGTATAFDAAVLMKVLPKFHGSRGKLEQALKEVLAWCLNPDVPDKQQVVRQFETIQSADDLQTQLAPLPYRCPRTAARVRRMLWSLYTTGFAAFG